MTIDLPGFADPVGESQACFRAVLDATASPGSIHTVTTPLAAPPPLSRAAAAVLLTLVDGETPLWLDPAAGNARDWITFHCGAALCAPSAAAYAMAVGLIDLSSLSAGTDDAPELGATVILQVAALGQGRVLVLSGPGLETPRRLAVEGLPDDFAAQWAANHALFPRGVDLILCAGDRLAALPRTVAIGET